MADGGEESELVLGIGEIGDEGIDVVRREALDALFVDLRLPGRNGISVIQEARRFKPQLSTVVITGHASFETSVEALRLGACDYVTKPFTAKEISFALAAARFTAKCFRAIKP